MGIEGAFILVVFAMLVLLSAGGLASYIEKAVYHGLRDTTQAPGGQLDAEYNRLRHELVALRERKTQLDDDLAKLQKERASLLDQERRMADRNANMVAEAGYPVPGAKGYYMVLEGPAAVMPFAGLASVPMAIGGRRQVRLVVWGAGMAEAKNIALNWMGEGGSIEAFREFSGRLSWREA